MAKPYLVIFFMPLFLFLSLGLMNLVTAVLVEHALEHAAHEHDAERLKTKQKIKARRGNHTSHIDVDIEVIHL